MTDRSEYSHSRYRGRSQPGAGLYLHICPGVRSDRVDRAATLAYHGTHLVRVRVRVRVGLGLESGLGRPRL